MILLTTGTQLPFPRLVKILNKWNKLNNIEVIAQVGDDSNAYENLNVKKYLTAKELDDYMREAEIIVSHAGIGSILNAYSLQKPIILFPRMQKFYEHRNDHQISTCKSFQNHLGIHIAYTESEIFALLDRRSTLSKCNSSLCANKELLIFLEGVFS